MENGTEGGHAGTAGDAHHGGAGVGNVEAAEGAAEGDGLSGVQVLMNPGGAESVGHQANHQFDVAWITGIGGHGIGTQRGAGGGRGGHALQMDVLAGAKRKWGLGIDRDAQVGDIGREERLADK